MEITEGECMNNMKQMVDDFCYLSLSNKLSQILCQFTFHIIVF